MEGTIMNSGFTMSSSFIKYIRRLPRPNKDEETKSFIKFNKPFVFYEDQITELCNNCLEYTTASVVGIYVPSIDAFVDIKYFHSDQPDPLGACYKKLFDCLPPEADKTADGLNKIIYSLACRPEKKILGEKPETTLVKLALYLKENGPHNQGLGADRSSYRTIFKDHKDKGLLLPVNP